MRLIDIDALPDDCAWCGDALIEAINDAPTIDAVEVVRCKDCKYWAGENGERITIPAHENCYFFVADDFCSYGERGEADDSF